MRVGGGNQTRDISEHLLNKQHDSQSKVARETIRKRKRKRGKRAKRTPVDESNNGHGTDQDSSNVQIPRDGGDTDKIITIKQLGVASMLRVELLFNKTIVMAVVDTAAEVTIISDKLYESLPSKPTIKRHTMMHGAGRDMKMKTFIIGPVNIGIGSRIYPSDIYVAPIDDYMLLGLDFLYKYNVILDCSKNKFVINGETLPMDYGKAKNVPKVSKVTVPGKTVIPPNSAIHINGKLSSQIENYIMEPDSDIPVMILRCMYANQTNSRLCLVSASDRYYTIRKGTVGVRPFQLNPQICT
jgi:hypothetical protein